jgi:hypothetical protein
MAIERSRRRQASWVTKLKEGDANTRYFHLRVNARRRKNFIHRLKRNNGWVTEHDQKKEIIHDHLKNVMKKGAPRATTINWAAIPPTTYDLSGLDAPFLEDEVKAAIDNSPSDKAPGPDGFTGAFFKACWDIIKGDILAVVNQFSNLHTNNLHWLNSANIAPHPEEGGSRRDHRFLAN